MPSFASDITFTLRCRRLTLACERTVLVTSRRLWCSPTYIYGSCKRSTFPMATNNRDPPLYLVCKMRSSWCLESADPDEGTSLPACTALFTNIRYISSASSRKESTRQRNPESLLTRSQNSIFSRARRIPVYCHLMHDCEKTEHWYVGFACLLALSRVSSHCELNVKFL